MSFPPIPPFTSKTSSPPLDDFESAHLDSLLDTPQTPESTLDGSRVNYFTGSGLLSSTPLPSREAPDPLSFPSPFSSYGSYGLGGAQLKGPLEAVFLQQQSPQVPFSPPPAAPKAKETRREDIHPTEDSPKPPISSSILTRIQNCLPFRAIDSVKGESPLAYGMKIQSCARKNFNAYMYPSHSLKNRVAYFALYPCMVMFDTVFNTAFLVVKVVTALLVAIGKLAQKIVLLGKDVHTKETFQSITPGIASQCWETAHCIYQLVLHLLVVGFVMNRNGATNPIQPKA